MSLITELKDRAGCYDHLKVCKGENVNICVAEGCFWDGTHKMCVTLKLKELEG